MKKALRRMLGILCALAITASCLTASMFVSAAGNLALGGTAFADSVHPEYAGAPSTMIDGNRTSTRWQSAIECKDGTTSYIGVAWDTAQTFDTIRAYWEASYPDQNTEVYIAESPAALAVMDQSRFDEVCYTEGDTAWTKVTAALVRSDGDDGVEKIDVWTLEEPVTAYAVKLLCLEKGTEKNANMSCFEIEVYDFSAGAPYDVTEVQRAITYVNRAFGEDNIYGYGNESWTAFVNARTEALGAVSTYADEIVDDEVLTQEELNDYATRLYAAAASLTGDGVVTENRLENGIMIYNTADMQSYASGSNYRTLTDGLYENNSNCWQPSSTSTPVYIKLKNAADMNEIVIFAESTNEIYGIEYTTADVSEITDTAGMDALTWTDTGAERAYSVEYASSVAYSFYTFDTVSDVTAVRLTCTTSNSGWCKLREVMAFADGTDTNNFTGTVTYASGTDTQFVATNITVSAVDGKTVTAEYTVTRGGAQASGSVAIENAYAMITLGDHVITAGNINGGHFGDYVTGVLFTNLQEGDEVSVTFVCS